MPVTEDWSARIAERWRLFGDPMPLVITGPGGVRALWHHGDSSFTSGVYTRRSFDGRHGLAVEARISTPIDRLTWQNLDVDLDGATDSAALERWDHRTGAPPPRVDVGHGCEIEFPGGEGALRLGTLALVAGTSHHVTVDPALRSGRWWTLRLQILPDGRCGVAVNGRALWILPNPLQRGRPFRLFLQGYSYHTRMLVGPLKVWEGVPGGVGWERPESIAAPGRRRAGERTRR